MLALSYGKRSIQLRRVEMAEVEEGILEEEGEPCTGRAASPLVAMP